MRQGLSRGLLAIYLVFLYLLPAQSFTRFQGLLRNKRDNSCHYQKTEKTWLIPREIFMMLIAHFPGIIGPSIEPISGSFVQTKKTPWHLLTESRFTQSTSKPFAIAMPLFSNIIARWHGSVHDSRIFENSNIADKLRDGALDDILVGDSGYACRAYLMTPILKQEKCATILHISVLGVLLGDTRFPCLYLGLRTALLWPHCYCSRRKWQCQTPAHYFTILCLIRSMIQLNCT